MSYGEVYANPKGSLLMDLAVDADLDGDGPYRAMLLIRCVSGDGYLGEDLYSIRHIDHTAFEWSNPNRYEKVLYFGPPR